MPANDGRNRVVIEDVRPQVDGGAFPIKRVVGEQVVVEADAFADGHDALTVVLRYREADEEQWREIEMQPLVNDRWQGVFTVTKIGQACYAIAGWMDHFKSWARDMQKRIDANSVTPIDLEIGARMVDAARAQAEGTDADLLGAFARNLRDGKRHDSVSPDLATLMYRYAERPFISYSPELAVTVDRERAAFSAWYSMFPRSAAQEPGKHGTFKDVENWLPYISELGFDVLYLTPIHPIGTTFRKGKDNRPTADVGEPGSPYAIGSDEGGHTAVHPELGRLEDFRSLVRKAREYRIEIALDNAFNASPDHPWVQAHPEWFKQRPDGTIQYAENPPKKYQDIYPLNFESDDWQNLWTELKGFFEFWIEQGVRIYRVDNPHTKAFPFWQWCLAELKRDYPDLIFLSEAFTRPKVMYRLAKLGFTQSYTYFAWRTVKWELQQYMTELTQSEVKEFFRPNFWPTTHDILTPQFYPGHRSTFVTRLVMAATMTANYGIYGPSYEQMLYTPVGPREEYIDNEKYELKHWNLDDPNSLAPLVARLNRIRRENVALQRDQSIRFHRIENDGVESEQLIAYTKQSPDGKNTILVVANLDPVNSQSAWLRLPLAELGITNVDAYPLVDLLTGTRYTWNGEWNYVVLSPESPVHIFRIEPASTEQNFDYYA